MGAVPTDMDHNGCTRLETARDHPMLVPHSRFHTQGWRAKGDISLILSKSPPENPSLNGIIATEKYVSGYACKGNQPTGAIVDLFNDMVNCAGESTGASTKSLCNKLLMGIVKRDIPTVEASYEFSSLPLYRSSHTLSLNKSTIAPVGWLPLQAYPDTYFSVAMIPLTEGFSGGLLERIREISPFARQPCV
jgi:hypothetical protein